MTQGFSRDLLHKFCGIDAAAEGVDVLGKPAPQTVFLLALKDGFDRAKFRLDRLAELGADQVS
jgi:hypothetical protein